jgi:hypothetical protein
LEKSVAQSNLRHREFPDTVWKNEAVGSQKVQFVASRFTLRWSAYVRLLSMKNENAREHWVQADENPPVGLILCARKGEAIARYALEGLSNKMKAAECRMALPDEKELAAEIGRTQAMLQDRKRLPLVWRKKR